MLGDGSIRYFPVGDSSSHALSGAFVRFPEMRNEALSTRQLQGGRIERPPPYRMRSLEEFFEMYIYVRMMCFAVCGTECVLDKGDIGALGAGNSHLQCHPLCYRRLRAGGL